MQHCPDLTYYKYGKMGKLFSGCCYLLADKTVHGSHCITHCIRVRYIVTNYELTVLYVEDIVLEN